MAARSPLGVSKSVARLRVSTSEDAEAGETLAGLIALRDRLALELGGCRDVAWRAQLSADLTVVRAQIAALRTRGADSGDSDGQ